MTLSLPAVSRVSELITRSSSRSCWMQRALRHRAPPHAPAAREIRRRSVTLFVENEGKIITLVGRDVMDYDVLSARCLSLARPRHSNPRRWELRCGLRRRGRQGLGFKYVSQFTRTPSVHSRDFHFHFDFPRLGKCCFFFEERVHSRTLLQAARRGALLLAEPRWEAVAHIDGRKV